MEAQQETSGDTGAPGPTWSGTGAARASDQRPHDGGGLEAAGLAFPRFRRRLGGMVIDVALTLAIVRVFELAVGLDVASADLNDPAVQELVTRAFVVETVFVAAYFWFWNSIGWSPGKRAVGLRIVAEDGMPPGAGRGFGRTAGSVISVLSFGLGHFWAAWDPHSQTWHDKMASTYVVHAPAAAEPGI